ncbi:MAG: hypothetical protein WDM88_01370 [Galbitalea sp.]
MSTAMMRRDDLPLEEYIAAVAVSRLVLGPGARLQAPPNLTDEAELSMLVRAGIDDWGGVSPLTPRPRQPRAPVARDRGALAPSRPPPATRCTSA